MSTQITEGTRRPASVTFVVVLTWLVAIVTVVDGIFLLVGTDPTLESLGLSTSRSTTTGWIFIAVGLLIALFAMALSNGSRFARLLITVLMLMRFALGSIAVIILFGTPYVWPAMIVPAVALIVLGMLWNTRASAWFASQ